MQDGGRAAAIRNTLQMPRGHTEKKQLATHTWGTNLLSNPSIAIAKIQSLERKHPKIQSLERKHSMAVTQHVIIISKGLILVNLTHKA